MEIPTIPEPNDDVTKVLLSELVMQIPEVRKYYNASRKGLINFVKAFNANEGGVIPAVIYQPAHRARIQKIREQWKALESVWPTLTWMSEEPSILKIALDLEKSAKDLDPYLKSCVPWLVYSNSVKALQVRVQDSSYDHMYFHMRETGQILCPCGCEKKENGRKVVMRTCDFAGLVPPQK